jgi:hypothetical protein
MTHFGINQRSFPQSKVCALRRNGVRIAPFRCALYTVLLCGLHRIMQLGVTVNTEDALLVIKPLIIMIIKINRIA